MIFEYRMIDPHKMMLRSPDASYKAIVTTEPGASHVHVNHQSFKVEKIIQSKSSDFKKEHLLVDESPIITTPMPGKVLKVFVKEGDEIRTKQSLLILEAMKMENNITAPRDGIVKRINFSEGDLVEAGQTLIELE
ncbi:acetyl-CoA carboxylase biotin carboxyl carrier protein subunit [candidate division KSB1 bacterium]|nr:acetyl-CoA carboxylase biotin carboxyl carrier protein subunit [candidate division KSB1 bacterium]